MRLALVLVSLAAVLLIASQWNWEDRASTTLAVSHEITPPQEAEASAAPDLVELPSETLSPADDRRPAARGDKTRNQAGATLRVVSAVDGRDLDEVTIIESYDRHNRAMKYPRMPYARTLATGAKSPFSLPALGFTWSVDQSLWFVAPGFAWQHLSLSPQPSDDLVVTLERGGEIKIHLAGHPSRERIMLNVHSADESRPLTWFMLNQEDTLLIRGLVPGPYILRMLRHPVVPGMPEELAETTVTVKAGEETPLVMSVPAPVGPVPVDAKFQVDFGDGWDPSSRIDVRLRWVEDLRRGNTDQKTVTCMQNESTPAVPSFFGKARGLAPGRYQLEVIPSHHNEMIEVLPDEPNDFTIQVPDVSLVEVRVLDEDSGSLVSSKLLSWHPLMPAEVPVFESVTVAFQDGVARLKAPLGEIFLMPAVAKEYTQVPGQTWFVKPGQNEFVVRVKHACGLRVTAMVNGKPKRALSFGSISLRAVGHSGKTTRQSMGDNYWCHVTGPGRYMLQVADVLGYEPVPDQPIDIRPGEIVELSIHLVPTDI